MTRIFHLAAARKGSYRRAPGETEAPDSREQLSLFSGSIAKIVRMEAGLSPFDAALLMDRTGRAEARSAYLHAVEREDRVADAYCNLGILEAAAGAYDDAIECFSKSLAVASNHFEAHYNLGCLYLDLEMFAPARVHLGVAASGMPESAELQFNLAVALAGVGRFEASAVALRQFRSLSPAGDQDPSAGKLLGELERELRERA